MASYTTGNEDEENVIAKVKLVQDQLNKQEQQLNKQEESNRQFKADNVEMKKSLNEIMKQLERMSQQTSRDVQAEDMKKGIAEADGIDIEPKVVVAGGWNGSKTLNSVEMFSLATGTWTPLQPMREDRQGASSFVYDNQIFVTGGLCDVSGEVCTKSIEKLSLNAVQIDHSITWEKIPAELPGRLYGHSTVVHNGRLIVIGGYDGDKAVYSDSITEISLVPPYTSKLLATMPQVRYFHGVSLKFGDKILIVGGAECGSYASALRNVVMYDITKNECQELAPLPYYVNEMGTAKWGDDNVIIMGGVDNNAQPLSKGLMYNIKTQKSRKLPLKYRRQGCMAAVVGDNVIVMGGRDERGNFYKSVECLRLDSNTWQELPKMHEARSRATAVVC